MPGVNPERIIAAYDTAMAQLFKERQSEGYWVGELSTSALSTAVAIMALSLVQRNVPTAGSFAELIEGGLQWLANNQNADGGWGDTTISFSNISTTMLCRAAIHISGRTNQYQNALKKCEAWLFSKYGETPEELAEAVRQRYGKDRTFAVPILTTCALAGLVKWREVPSLPFEMACFPQSWYAMLRLHVVSYALPALIAIGQCIYQHNPPWNPISRTVRSLAKKKSLAVLQKIQPSNGGFLEATPLTSFVTLSLASIGLGDHPVAKKGIEFICQSVRDDGSWPIDTNLSTWVSTLAVNALASAGDLEKLEKKDELANWLAEQQYTEVHPYTGAPPGAWAWTPLPGGVPDCDDTPGALLAMCHLRPDWQGNLAAVEWMLNLQNSDGGFPTFCRGWGQLPFDRSGTDLTAHALRALTKFLQTRTMPVASDLEKRINRAITRGFLYLKKNQRSDGSWLPLWFGNQHAEEDINPTYGTAKVLAAYRDCQQVDTEECQKGIAWLRNNQNDDGGWGGCRGTPSSIEETALALEIMLDNATSGDDCVNKGLLWLVQKVENQELSYAKPIGFYFAKLWYYEKLYPIVFTVAALGKAKGTLPASR